MPKSRDNNYKQIKHHNYSREQVKAGNSQQANPTAIQQVRQARHEKKLLPGKKIIQPVHSQVVHPLSGDIVEVLQQDKISTPRKKIKKTQARVDAHRKVDARRKIANSEYKHAREELKKVKGKDKNAAAPKNLLIEKSNLPRNKVRLHHTPKPAEVKLLKVAREQLINYGVPRRFLPRITYKQLELLFMLFSIISIPGVLGTDVPKAPADDEANQLREKLAGREFRNNFINPKGEIAIRTNVPKLPNKYGASTEQCIQTRPAVHLSECAWVFSEVTVSPSAEGASTKENVFRFCTRFLEPADEGQYDNAISDILLAFTYGDFALGESIFRSFSKKQRAELFAKIKRIEGIIDVGGTLNTVETKLNRLKFFIEPHVSNIIYASTRKPGFNLQSHSVVAAPLDYITEDMNKLQEDVIFEYIEGTSEILTHLIRLGVVIPAVRPITIIDELYSLLAIIPDQEAVKKAEIISIADTRVNTTDFRNSYTVDPYQIGLLAAAKQGHLELMRFYLARGAQPFKSVISKMLANDYLPARDNVNSLSIYTETVGLLRCDTAFSFAVLTGEIEPIQLIMEHKPLGDQLYKWVLTAATRTQGRMNQKQLAFFMEAGFSLDRLDGFKYESEKISVLHRAAIFPYTDFLTSALAISKTHLNTRDFLGRTPLHHAVIASLEYRSRAYNPNAIPPAIKAIEILLKAGADPSIGDNKGNTPFNLIPKTKHDDLRKLFEGYKLEKKLVIVDKLSEIFFYVTMKNPIVGALLAIIVSSILFIRNRQESDLPTKDKNDQSIKLNQLTGKLLKSTWEKHGKNTYVNRVEFKTPEELSKSSIPGNTIGTLDVEDKDIVDVIKELLNFTLHDNTSECKRENNGAYVLSVTVKSAIKQPPQGVLNGFYKRIIDASTQAKKIKANLAKNMEENNNKYELKKTKDDVAETIKKQAQEVKDAEVKLTRFSDSPFLGAAVNRINSTAPEVKNVIDRMHENYKREIEGYKNPEIGFEKILRDEINQAKDDFEKKREEYEMTEKKFDKSAINSNKEPLLDAAKELKKAYERSKGILDQSNKKITEFIDNKVTVFHAEFERIKKELKQNAPPIEAVDGHNCVKKEKSKAVQKNGKAERVGSPLSPSVPRSSVKFGHVKVDPSSPAPEPIPAAAAPRLYSPAFHKPAGVGRVEKKSPQPPKRAVPKYSREQLGEYLHQYAEHLRILLADFPPPGELYDEQRKICYFAMSYYIAKYLNCVLVTNKEFKLQDKFRVFRNEFAHQSALFDVDLLRKIAIKIINQPSNPDAIKITTFDDLMTEPPKEEIKALIDLSKHALKRSYELRQLLETTPDLKTKENIMAAIKISLAQVGEFNTKIYTYCWKRRRSLNFRELIGLLNDKCFHKCVKLRNKLHHEFPQEGPDWNEDSIVKLVDEAQKINAIKLFEQMHALCPETEINFVMDDDDDDDDEYFESPNDNFEYEQHEKYEEDENEIEALNDSPVTGVPSPSLVH